jgi:hypothetical protein
MSPKKYFYEPKFLNATSNYEKMLVGQSAKYGPVLKYAKKR